MLLNFICVFWGQTGVLRQQQAQWRTSSDAFSSRILHRRSVWRVGPVHGLLLVASFEQGAFGSILYTFAKTICSKFGIPLLAGSKDATQEVRASRGSVCRWLLLRLMDTMRGASYDQVLCVAESLPVAFTFTANGVVARNGNRPAEERLSWEVGTSWFRYTNNEVLTSSMDHEPWPK